MALLNTLHLADNPSGGWLGGVITGAGNYLTAREIRKADARQQVNTTPGGTGSGVLQVITPQAPWQWIAVAAGAVLLVVVLIMPRRK